MPCPYCGSIYYLMMTPSKDVAVCDGCGRESDAAVWGSQPKKKLKVGYEPGMHGAKGKEQKRLGTSGTTHQSEHVVGYEVFGKGVDRGESPFARKIENTAPAYQEEYEAHRKHIGTGSWKDYRGTGQSSDSYREHQRRLVASKQVGNAVQLNQLHYAHQPEFRPTDPTTKANLKKADQSFETMVSNFPPVPFKFGDAWGSVGMSEKEKAESLLARWAAREGAFPSLAKELEVMKKFKILPGDTEKLDRFEKSFGVDQHGIPKDGNCLFHAIWSCLISLFDNVGFTTNDDLRRQAVKFLEIDPQIAEIGAVDRAYLDRMALSGTWGGALEAMALAYVWGIRITIKAPSYSVSFNDGASQSIEIHYDGSGHYSTGPLG